MTQQEKVLRYLKEHKNGADYIELTRLYIGNARQVIKMLRDKGHEIEMEERERNGRKYNVYVLIKENTTN